MKNIHVLPTDKPSSLYFSGNNSELLFLKGHIFYRAFGISPQNIYITSDEEIKEGVNQWYLDKVLNKPRNSSGSQYGENQNVIILTTDQDLIKDGVQAIDDEFLEWFVKNPSCEWVKTEIVEYGFDEVPICIYKIIIPKEEPKQETLEVMKKEQTESIKIKTAVEDIIEVIKMNEKSEKKADLLLVAEEKLKKETNQRFIAHRIGKIDVIRDVLIKQSFLIKEMFDELKELAEPSEYDKIVGDFLNKIN